MFTIEKKFEFSASHRLKGLPPEHPCSRLHGHNYAVILTLRSEHLNEVGFVRDYRELDTVKKWIDEQIDHRDINKVFPKMNPTAENIAKLIFEAFCMEYPELVAVTVQETEKTKATYEPEDRRLAALVKLLKIAEREMLV